jgi:hypothetical protein
MSQREKAGLSWPGFSVGALEPFEVGPCVKNACRGKSRWFDPSPPLFLWSLTTGVAHAAKS